MIFYSVFALILFFLEIERSIELKRYIYIERTNTLFIPFFVKEK